MTDKVLDRAMLADGKEMLLIEAGEHVAIRVGKRSLMYSNEHGSEDSLGRIVADAVAGVTRPRILIGGLGLGFTLRAALDRLPRSAKVDVAELVPEVARWNKTICGAYAGHPLKDRRVRLLIEDVGKVIAGSTAKYDAIALDVDNGPDALTHPGNANLYKRAGLERSRTALREGGVLAVWSAFPSRTFRKWLEIVGTVKQVRAEPSSPGGPRYYIWLATRPDGTKA